MRLVALEGIDGAGKTTVAKMLAEQINEKGVGKAIYIDKKSSDAMTEFQHTFMTEIYQTLWKRKKDEPINEIDEESWMYLHLLWYHMVQSFVLPKYASYDYVIMDGWIYKFLARNIVNQKNDFNFTLKVFDNIYKGDYLFWLKVNPEICYNRKQSDVKPSECGIHRSIQLKDVKTSFIEYQSSVDEAYEKLKDCFNLIEIDANKKIDDIVKKVLEYL